MAHWRVDPDRTRFRISFRPGPPGMSVHISGVTGTFEATVDEAGRPDLSRPLTGSFAMTVDDLQLGNTLLTTAVRRWLGGSDEVAVTGRIGEISPAGDAYELVVELGLRGQTHRLAGISRTERTPEGDLVVIGGTVVDPRRLGVPIPPLVPLRSRADWTIHLGAAGDGEAVT